MTSFSSNQLANTSSASNMKARSLTNFSIESLIGADHQSQCHQTSQPRPPEPLSLDYRYRCDNIATNKQQPSTFKHKGRPKNFLCPACKMAFSNNGQLKNHVRIHTGERPFSCNHPGCNKTFTRNEELTRHKLIHTGVRPHACTTCGKRFGRKDHLKKHTRTHERKRLRKKIFMPTRSSRFIHDDVFVPPKPTKSDSISPIRPQVAKPQISPPHLMNAISQTPVTSTFQITPMPPIITTTSPPAGPTYATPETVQRLSSDYWSRFYNLVSLYQQHCQPIDRLGSLFRKP